VPHQHKNTTAETSQDTAIARNKLQNEEPTVYTVVYHFLVILVLLICKVGFDFIF
jgi:hypothetical protein